jgi:hypothetical protein
LEGLSDEEAMAMIAERRSGGALAVDLPVKQVEFRMLDVAVGTRGEDRADSDFFAEALPRAAWDIGDDNLPAVERVVLVHRLREVVTQVGFTRFEAVGADEKGELDLEGIAPAALSPEPLWFPAIENRGEGVFVVFRAEAITAWLAQDAVKARSTQLLRGVKAWESEHPRSERHWPGLPYVMLHSLSHLLLTQIALECGYPAASLRERVYALPDEQMFGILIHTGTSDAEGTLGGLVEAGRRIGEHLVAAVETARLCSNDPVCAEHDPSAEHDPLRLHGAACHGCLLIAETSCEQRNDWLDRALVVPTVATPGAAFFG